MDNFKKLAIIEAIVIAILLIASFIVLSVKIGNSKEATPASNADDPTKIKIYQSVFGYLPDGQKVIKYILRNRRNFEVHLVSYGATIKSIFTKDKNQKLTNVVLGFNSLEEFSNRTLNPYFGCIVGRLANRVSNAEFELDGKTYHLDKNDGNNSLHGGYNSFCWKNWQSTILEDGVKFSLESKDDEGGYPGTVNVDVFYRLNNVTNTLLIEYSATTSQPTPLDLTNHAYFNLAGENSGEKIYNHLFRIYSDYYLDSRPDLTLTGKFNAVNQTKYDFRNFTRLGDRIVPQGEWPQEGFDNYFVSNQQSGNKIIASVRNPENGIYLDIWSNQNGVQFDTANHLNITKPSNGQKYSHHEAFCLETHNFPDAVNHPYFPSSIVRPEGKYVQRTILSFKIKH